MHALIVEELRQPDAPPCEPPNGSYYVSTEDVRAVREFLAWYPALISLVSDCFAFLQEQVPGAPIRVTLHRDPETGSGDTSELREVHVDALIDVSQYDSETIFETLFDLRDPVDQWAAGQPWAEEFGNTLRVGVDFLPEPAASRLQQMYHWHGGSTSSYIGYRNRVLGPGSDNQAVLKVIQAAFEDEQPDLPDDEWARISDYFEVQEEWLRSQEPCSTIMRECWPEMKRSDP